MSHALRFPRRHARHRRSVGGLILAVVAGATAVLVPAGPVAATSPPMPWITSFTPNHGPAAGGNGVDITGNSLNLLGGGGFQVFFGTTPAQVVSATASTALVKAPRGLSGTTVDVRIAYNGFSPDGPTSSTADDYTYDGRTRRSLKLSPDHGTPLGGTEVTLTANGVAFRNPQSVTFGGKPAQILSSTDTSVTVKTPAGTPGEKVTVSLTTAAGDLEGTQWTRFAYDFTTAAPRVDSVTGTPGAIDEFVTVRGANFSGPTQVWIDGEPIYTSVSSDEELSFRVPNLMPGTYDVVVKSPAGTSDNTAADDLEILPSDRPTFASMSPNHGPAGGGTRVTIRGRNLGAVTAVQFEWRNGTDLEVVSDSELRVTTPEIVTFNDAVDVRLRTATGEVYIDYAWSRNDFGIDLVPGTLTLSPNHGPAAAPTTVELTGAGGLDIRRVAYLYLLRAGKDPLELQYTTNTADRRYTVTIPAGSPGETARIQAQTYEHTPLNGDGDLFTWDGVAGAPKYAVTGQATLKTVARSTFGVAGYADLTFGADGAVRGPLAFSDFTTRMVSGGWLPVVAKLGMVPSGETSGTLGADGLKITGRYRLKVKDLNLFGAIPLVIGNGCQTKLLSTIALTGPNFTVAGGGLLTSTFAISDLNGCGPLAGLVSPLTASTNNTLTLSLAPR